jgi:hypothetical protein
MDRLTDSKRTTFYRHEATACATAALATSIAEIKQAYLELEQGWLCLTPKPENNSAVTAELNTVLNGDTKPNEPPLRACQAISEDDL